MSFDLDAKPGTRSFGKLKKGAPSSKRRNGPYCHGYRGFPCCGDSRRSKAHYLKRKERGNLLDCFVEEGKVVSVIMDCNGNVKQAKQTANKFFWY